MSKKVNFGVKNVKFALASYDDDTKSHTYSTVKDLSGAITVSITPNTSEVRFYADDSQYYFKRGKDTHTGTIELTNITDEFKTEILGYLLDDNGVLVDKKGKINQVAITFEVDGENGNGEAVPKKYWMYRLAISDTNIESTSIAETPEPSSSSITLDFEVIPREKDNLTISSLQLLGDKSNQAEYDLFNVSVYEPVFA